MSNVRHYVRHILKFFSTMKVFVILWLFNNLNSLPRIFSNCLGHVVYYSSNNEQILVTPTLTKDEAMVTTTMKNRMMLTSLELRNMLVYQNE